MTSFCGSMAKVLLCVLNMLMVFLALVIIMVGCQMNGSGFGPGDEEIQASSPPGLVTTEIPNLTEIPVSSDDSLERWNLTSSTLVLTGTVLAIIGVLGFSAAMFESETLLNVYLFMLGTLNVMTFSFGLAMMLYSTQVIFFARQMFAEMMMASGQPGSFNWETVNRFQRTMKCCGMDQPDDWLNQTIHVGHVYYPYSKQQHLAKIYPASCCDVDDPPSALLNQKSESSEGKPPCCTEDNLAFRDGCFSKIQMTRYQILGKFCVATIILLVAFVLALTCTLERDRRLETTELVNLQYAAHISLCRNSFSGFCQSPHHHHHHHRQQQQQQPQPQPQQPAAPVVVTVRHFPSKPVATPHPPPPARSNNSRLGTTHSSVVAGSSQHVPNNNHHHRNNNNSNGSNMAVIEESDIQTQPSQQQFHHYPSLVM